MNKELFSSELVKGIIDIMRPQIVSIILYGSVARGEDATDSDIDVALIVNGNLSNATEERLSDFIVELNLKYEKVFSVIDIEQGMFEKWGNISPFYKNVKKEGIVLWKAA